MVNQCAIHGCVSKSSQRKKHISTFALPRDPEVLELWLQNLPHYVSTRKNARICQLHFRDEDIIKVDKVIIDNEVREYPRKNFKLKSRAVPVFFCDVPKTEPGRKNFPIREKISQGSDDKIQEEKSANEYSNSQCEADCNIEDVLLDSNSICDLDDVAEFYQNCDDLQKNWIFLQERSRAFLCNISLDSDVAKMHGSVCIYENLRIVLGVAQERISEHYIPKYFNKIDSLNKLKNLMAFMERIISKVRKSSAYSVESSSQSVSILEDKMNIKESSLEDDNNFRNKQNEKLESGTKEVSTKLETETKADRSLKITSDDEYSNQNDNIDESRGINTNKAYTDQENPQLIEDTLETCRQSMETEEVCGLDEEYACDTSDQIDDIADQLYENNQIDKSGNIYEYNHDEELSNEEDENEFENVDGCETSMENDMDFDLDGENTATELIEDKGEEVDDLSGVMNTLKKWKAIDQVKNIHGYYTSESIEGLDESEMRTEQQISDKSELVATDSEYIEDLKLECDSENESRITECLDDEAMAPNTSNIKKENVEEIVTSEEKLSENEEKFSCASCGNKFPSKIEILNHLEHQCKGSASSNLTLFICEICNEAFESNFEISDHIMNAHNNVDVDQTQFSNGEDDENQLEHIEQHETSVGISDGPSKKFHKKCEFCDKEFTSKSGYTNHTNNKHGRQQKKSSTQKMYACPYCEKAYRSEVELDGHVNGHKGEKPYTCEFCQKSYQSKISLYTHTKTHTGEQKIYQCDQCEQTFRQKANCISHMRLHTGEKPYTCEHCGKGFTFKGLWKIHTRIHVGIMPYSCPVCYKKFHDKSSLRKHQLRQRHKGEAIIDENHIKVSMYRKKRSQQAKREEEIES